MSYRSCGMDSFPPDNSLKIDIGALLPKSKQDQHVGSSLLWTSVHLPSPLRTVEYFLIASSNRPDNCMVYHHTVARYESISRQLDRPA